MSADRVLWIAGASAGIGAATARLAAASGCRLVSATRCDAILGKLTTAGG